MAWSRSGSASPWRKHYSTRSIMATWRSRPRNCPTARAAGSATAVNQLLSDRTRQKNLKDRRIVVDVHITSHTARFVIRDDGPGFDRAAVSQPTGHCFELGENRGTVLMCA